jgi:hypothetical protein
MLKKKINKSSLPEYQVLSDIEKGMNQRYIQMLHSMNVTVLFNIAKALKNQDHGL